MTINLKTVFQTFKYGRTMPLNNNLVVNKVRIYIRVVCLSRV